MMAGLRMRPHKEKAMPSERLESARDYFDNIVEPGYQAFMNERTTFLIVYSMANGLYHFSEWLCFHHRDKIKAKYGSSVDTGGALWASVIEQRVTDAGFIRDLNNAAKHTKLRFDPNKPKNSDPSTGMHYAANTHIYTAGFGEGGYGEGAWGGGQRDVKMDENGREVLLEPIATELYNFWKALIDEIAPRPAQTITVTSTVPQANS